MSSFRLQIREHSQTRRERKHQRISKLRLVTGATRQNRAVHSACTQGTSPTVTYQSNYSLAIAKARPCSTCLCSQLPEKLEQDCDFKVNMQLRYKYTKVYIEAISSRDRRPYRNYVHLAPSFSCITLTT